MKSLILFSLLCTLAMGGTFKSLSLAELKTRQEKPCSIVHAWAIWCDVCVVEMPDFVRFLEKKGGPNVTIVDMSSVDDQKKSREFLARLKSPLTFYEKPKVADEAYIKGVDPQWDGTLPYTAVFHQGKKQKAWVGQMQFPLLEAELLKCSGSKK